MAAFRPRDIYPPAGGFGLPWHVRHRTVLLAAITVLLFGLLRLLWPSQSIVSNWRGAGITGAATLNEAAHTPWERAPAQDDIAAPLVSADAALAAYNADSTLLDADAGQRVAYYQRDLPGGGTLFYVVASLGDDVVIRVINADGAMPGSDSSGDTVWLDGQRHLATVADMAAAPYAAQEGHELLGAMAFGFHGDDRTSDEGTVVINQHILRVNAGRSTLCITRDGKAQIGLFDAAALANCAQAAGAGPVILWQGKIANPAVAVETGEFLPFNPLNEDFVQLDWRKKMFTGLYPKTVIGVGTRDDGSSFVVFVNSYGVAGLDLAAQLRAMGCVDAIGGDDDSSTQAVWRGAPVRGSRGRAVPDALGIYVRR